MLSPAHRRIECWRDPRWHDVGRRMVVPRRSKLVVSHKGYRKTEEKGATPDPLMGVWPFGYRLEPWDERATLLFYLNQAEAHLGSRCCRPSTALGRRGRATAPGAQASG